jgi:hypothetical protein
VGSLAVRRLYRLAIELPANRDRCGELRLLDDQEKTVCGPFPAAGRAGDPPPGGHGNRARNPLFRYGDTPTGAYRVASILRSGPRTGFPTPQWGPEGIIVLEPVGGDAAIAEANGRFHILICGGDLSRDGLLVSTSGGLRLSNPDMRALMRTLKKSPVTACEIRETKRIGGPRVAVRPGEPFEDPVRLPSKATVFRPAGRDALRTGASAFALGVAVSFVTLHDPAHADVSRSQSLHADAAHRDALGTQPNKTARAGRYVRLAYGEGAATPGPGSPITGGGQPTSGAGVHNGPADTQPPPNPSASTIQKDQDAVTAAQSRLNAALEARAAATTDDARQKAQIDIYNATQELNRARGQLRIDQFKGS